MSPYFCDSSNYLMKSMKVVLCFLVLKNVQFSHVNIWDSLWCFKSSCALSHLSSILEGSNYGSCLVFPSSSRPTCREARGVTPVVVSQLPEMTTGISWHGCQEKQERSFQINISLTGPQDLGGLPAQWSPLTGGQFPSKASGHRYQESQSSEKYDRSWFQGLLYNRWSSSSCFLCLDGLAGASLR